MEGNFREFLSILSDVIIPIAGAAVTYYQVGEAQQEKRGRSFVMANDVSPEDRGDYAEQCLDLYRRQYAKEIQAGEIAVRYLIYPPRWMQRADNPRFFPLRKTKVTISQTMWSKKPPRAGFLPYPREGFTYNKKQLLSGQSILFNGKLFALEATRGDLNQGTLELTVKNGGYFDFLDTCEYLVYELSHARKNRRKKPPYRLGLASPLPCRTRQSDLLDLTNRFAGIGVNNATILHNVDSPVDADDPQGPRCRQSYLLLHQRSGPVAEGRGAIHVIPAGSYQPVGPELRSAFNRDLSNTVYREFGEELLNVDEFSHLGEEGVLEDKYRRWEVLFLGLGFEPVNTKVEVLTAMKVDVDLPENRRLFGGAYTLEGLESYFETNYEGTLILAPLTEKNLLQYQWDPRTTPACKEILAVMLDHLDFFQKPEEAGGEEAREAPEQGFVPAGPEEIDRIFSLYEKRVEWMETQGIRQWNVNGYLEAYPKDYYRERQRMGELYVLKEGGRIAGAAVMRSEDENWADQSAASACYIHNLATALDAPGAGKALLEQIEALALRQGKDCLRLDCDADSGFLNGYYQALGYQTAGRCREGRYAGNLREKRLKP